MVEVGFWKRTVTCINCDSVLQLQYPLDVSGMLSKEHKNVIPFTSRCPCGSWYSKYYYRKEGL